MINKQEQTTIKSTVKFSGISLHHGIDANISFCPAPADYGICFKRKDLENSPCVEASLDNVHSLTRGTTISKNGITIHTIEHIMAALLGMGIDNVSVEMDASEPPLGDGSSLPFVQMIKKAGTVSLKKERKILELKEPLWLYEDDSSIVALPYDGFKISFTLSYKNTKLGDQFIAYDINSDNFLEGIASARTFCFYDEVEQLMDLGLIKGGSLDNAVVVTKDAILSKEEKRYNDECVRHKLLDVMGDLYLLGAPLKAHIIAIKSGHSLNVNFAKKIKNVIANNVEENHV